jgi:hypothetical protein
MGHWSDPCWLRRSAGQAPVVTPRCDLGESAGMTRTLDIRFRTWKGRMWSAEQPSAGPPHACGIPLGRPLDLDGAGRLRPAAPGPPAPRGRTAAVGAAPTARQTVSLPGAVGVRRLLSALGRRRWPPYGHGGLVGLCQVDAGLIPDQTAAAVPARAQQSQAIGAIGVVSGSAGRWTSPSPVSTGRPSRIQYSMPPSISLTR